MSFSYEETVVPPSPQLEPSPTQQQAETAPMPCAAGDALVALGLSEQPALSSSDAARVYAHVNGELHGAIGPAYQGSAMSPDMLGSEADLNGDGSISRFELLIGLPKLVRPAHWRDGLGAYIIKV